MFEKYTRKFRGGHSRWFSHFFTLVNWIRPSHLPAKSLLPSHAKIQDLQLMSLVNEPLSSEKILEVLPRTMQKGSNTPGEIPRKSEERPSIRNQAAVQNGEEKQSVFLNTTEGSYFLAPASSGIQALHCFIYYLGRWLWTLLVD
ncbi:hypothetical protein AVEN_177856-1 [Araneus ventricosus]|uniref:Uncharacterized protein n=1 Tax=Araneus ventricosus TaxID=182803 RepID=A0A4Y2KNS5_ARAVE|nr:hypothetical protein AVEN_177856-1 [Araneus ventricosus]